MHLAGQASATIDMASVCSRITPFVPHSRAHSKRSCVKVGVGAGRGPGRGRSDYLNFNWDDGDGDDLADVRNKYEDFLRQDKPAPVGGNMQFGNNRRRMLSSNRPFFSNSFDSFDMYDEFEDEFEDARPQLPRETEKRFMNGKHVLTNEEITAPLLRLIGPQKEQLGMKPLEQALFMANQQDMDLILINPEQAPPVARIIQWSKYKFEIEQASKERKAKATVTETKEIRLKPKTDDNDIATKIRSAQKFLEKGDKVKLSMRFEGRQLQFKEVGKEVLMKFIADLGEHAKVEGPLSFKGTTYQVMLTPGKSGTGSSGGGGGSSSSGATASSSKPAASAPAAAGASSTRPAPSPAVQEATVSSAASSRPTPPSPPPPFSAPAGMPPTAPLPTSPPMMPRMPVPTAPRPPAPGLPPMPMGRPGAPMQAPNGMPVAPGAPRVPVMPPPPQLSRPSGRP